VQEPRKIQAVLFDEDGVLVSQDYHTKAWHDLALKEDLKWHDDTEEKLRGISREDSLKLLLEDSPKTYTEEEKRALLEDKNQEYLSLIAQCHPTDLAPEILPTLLYLRGKGYKLAIASGSKNAPFVVAAFGLRPYVDLVVDGTMIQHPKPAAEVYELAARKLALPRSACLVVEDSAPTLENAEKAGFLGCGIGDGRKAQGSMFAIAALDELTKLL
jgi:beta-phosphoglucomutase